MVDHRFRTLVIAVAWLVALGATVALYLAHNEAAALFCGGQVSILTPALLDATAELRKRSVNARGATAPTSTGDGS